MFGIKVILFVLGVVSMFLCDGEKFLKEMSKVEQSQLYVLLYGLIPAISYGVFLQETGSYTIYPCMEQEGVIWWHVKEWGMPLYPYLFVGFCIIAIMFLIYRFYNGSRRELFAYVGMMNAEFFLVNGIVVLRNFVLDNLLNHSFIAILLRIVVDGFFTLTCLGVAVVGTPFIVIMSFLPETGKGLLHATAQIGHHINSNDTETNEKILGNAEDTQETSVYPPYLYSGTVCYGRGNRYSWGVEYVNESDNSDRIVITNIYSQTGSEMDTNAGHFIF